MNTVKCLFLCITLLGISLPLLAQDDCVNDKFINSGYFPEAKVTRNVVFGANRPAGSGTMLTLRMDIYEPKADTLPNRTNRPLIILAHGGSFIGGNRSECAPLCVSFAKMGYVTATIDYRVGLSGFPPDEVITTLAVVYAMHDMKAAVRYFRKDAVNGNTYDIDTNRIIIGGISAGAITAIQAAYLDDIAEIPAYLANDTAGLGGIEGKSGNAGYSSKVHGVINYAGAIGDTSWIEPGDAPIASYHYLGDVTVPFDTREVKVSGLPTGLIASGSGTMATRLNNIGVPNDLTTYTGLGHVEFLSGTEYDSVLQGSAKFTYNHVTCKNNTTGLFATSALPGFTIYPNPSSGSLTVKFDSDVNWPVQLSLYDQVGKRMMQTEVHHETEMALAQPHLTSGWYLVMMESRNGKRHVEKLIIE